MSSSRKAVAMADSHTPVTVVGLGSLGSALARAFLTAGHPTTVWNRDPERAAVLVEDGATHRPALADAVAASPLIVSVITTFAATRAALAPVAAALRGRTLVTLNSGTPTAARELAEWAGAHGIRFLGGAVKNVPAAVGKADTLLYFGGDRAIYDEHADTLRALGGDLVHLGSEPDLAALYESAVGATLLPTLLGFFEGAAMLQARGLSAASMVPYSAKWLRMIESLLPVLAGEIDDRDYTRLGSSVGLFHAAIDDEREFADMGVDISWHEPVHDLLRRAVEQGYRDQSVTAIIELLRTPGTDF
ncbi:NAD(P)-dependent oxidoreductase [Nocardia otitidiscaviarum]|uniref:NAD(P)-dependent oxidoreductase n=1 Tax=Nocardia otitidiscaviarum TaxID=1823 RepID=UPI001E4C8A0A|nr:NAD(P)-binding domain-containing protein [Nocardia otitidiscaviarum]